MNKIAKKLNLPNLIKICHIVTLFSFIQGLHCIYMLLLYAFAITKDTE